MTLKDEIETDIIKFFEQSEKQGISDKRETLRNLLGKYIHLSSAGYVMDHYDLKSIISQAKSKWVEKSFPLYLGDTERKVLETEQANLCLIESTISHINKNECLKKIPKFDYREIK